MQQPACVVHLRDVRRAQGVYTDASGRQVQQWPVVCVADIVEAQVRERSKRVWTCDPREVTCIDCKEVIRNGH